MNAFVEIVLPNHISHKYQLKDKNVSVGWSKECTITLPRLNEVHERHVLIEPNKSGAEVSVADRVTHLPKHNGNAFKKEQVLWGQDFYIGNICFRLFQEDDSGKRWLSRHIELVFAAGLIFVLLFLLFWTDGTTDDIDQEDHHPPSLFHRSKKCTQSETALYRAKQAEREGYAKMQRYPFSVKDGVMAVELISEAANCYRYAGVLDAEKAVRKRVQIWQNTIERDFRRHRLLLDRAMLGQHKTDAINEINILLGMLSYRDDGYTDWLRRLERKLIRLEDNGQ